LNKHAVSRQARIAAILELPRQAVLQLIFDSIFPPSMTH
jgi:hypothetical protein